MRDLEGFSLITLTEENFAEAIEVYGQGYKGLEEYAYTHPDDVRAYLEWMAKRDPQGLIGAKVGGKLVGFIGFDGNWFSKREQRKVGAIHELVVLKDFRRKGIGRALISKAVEHFERKGLDTVELWVGEGNHTARKFYEKLGFEEAGRYNYWIRMKASLEEVKKRLKGSKAQ
jgi:ribosomal protein S18 acetylase RimI-like enzyme